MVRSGIQTHCRRRFPWRALLCQRGCSSKATFSKTLRFFTKQQSGHSALEVFVCGLMYMVTFSTSFLFLVSNYCSLNECLIPQFSIGYSFILVLLQAIKIICSSDYEFVYCFLCYTHSATCLLFHWVSNRVFFSLVYHNLRKHLHKSLSCAWSIGFIWKTIEGNNRQ